MPAIVNLVEHHSRAGGAWRGRDPAHDSSVTGAGQRFGCRCALTPIGGAPTVDHRRSRHDVAGAAAAAHRSAVERNDGIGGSLGRQNCYRTRRIASDVGTEGAGDGGDRGEDMSSNSLPYIE